MKRWAQSIFVSALGIWVGGMAVLGFIVAPTVFRTVSSRLQRACADSTLVHHSW